mmetsp:Transcript_25558/g.75359  ORF Transcript_25558/g.75359 Transcript_25558/m.75359 type:complete len:215 (+) Transcript_25558:724-1368(+)
MRLRRGGSASAKCLRNGSASTTSVPRGTTEIGAGTTWRRCCRRTAAAATAGDRRPSRPVRMRRRRPLRVILPLLTLRRARSSWRRRPRPLRPAAVPPQDTHLRPPAAAESGAGEAAAAGGDARPFITSITRVAVAAGDSTIITTTGTLTARREGARPPPLMLLPPSPSPGRAGAPRTRDPSRRARLRIHFTSMRIPIRNCSRRMRLCHRCRFHR